MPRLRKRGRKFWADCYYFDGTKRVRVERSTGIVDDGTAATRRTAERVARDIEASLAAGESRRARGTSLARAYAELAEAKRLAGRSNATINITLEKSLHPLRYFKGRDAEAITSVDLKAYATYATQTRAGATVERELRELSMALKAVGVTPPKPPQLAKSKPRERWLTPAERLALLEQVMPRWRDHIVVYLQLGLSKGELIRVTSTDVELERNTVRVRGTKTNARDRVLPMPRDVRAIIERKLRGAKRGEPLFARWNPGNADRHLRLAAKRAGLGPLSFNDLRRTFVTTLAREGFSALQLKPLTGHTSTRMIDAHYARMGDGAQAQHIVDSLPTMPPDERKGARGVAAWNRGKRRNSVAGTASKVDAAAPTNERKKPKTPRKS